MNPAVAAQLAELRRELLDHEIEVKVDLGERAIVCVDGELDMLLTGRATHPARQPPNLRIVKSRD